MLSIIKTAQIFNNNNVLFYDAIYLVIHITILNFYILLFR
jgi:hypothetical protein